MAAGTSVGGLIGGSFATGMTAAELDAMLSTLDWDGLFGSFNFKYKNLRRRTDARTYPSRLEFGLKGGIRAPTALNNGQQVDRLIDRIAAPYYAISSFDSLPTPFRTVAVDLLTARQVVIDRGSLARAIRATVSFPGLFPPVQTDGQVLVDGGAMNNVPADVVRAMGASVVIAVNVGDLRDRTSVDYSMFGMMAETLDAMIRANTRDALAAADLVLNVPVDDVGSLDWRQSRQIVEAGYLAAEAMRDRLLPHAVDAAEWDRWVARRKAARKTMLPRPAFVTFEGVGRADEQRMAALLSKHIGQDVDPVALEKDLDELIGLERYETIWWLLSTNAAGETGLTIRARPRPYAPPFLMLGLRLESATSDDLEVSALARYLRFDVAGSGSELRIDATAGSDPALTAHLYRPLGGPMFVAAQAGVSERSLNVFDGDAVVARYGQKRVSGALDAGVNLGRLSDARVGFRVETIDADVLVGDPGLPRVSGRQTLAHAGWRHDSQDSPVVPSGGVRAFGAVNHAFDGPSTAPADGVGRSSAGLTQLAGEASAFWSLKDRNRLFVLGGVGTSFEGRPLRFDQFALGSPLHLAGFGLGQLFGDHYVLGTAGYLREVANLPSFIGGRIFAGAWLENGGAFDDWIDASWHSHVSGGLIADTVLGPVMLGVTAGSGRHWRTYVAIGPLF